MLGFRKKDRVQDDAVRSERAQKSTGFGIYNALSSGQRSATGDRGEICSNAMNNNQRLSALMILRNTRDDD
jgi:hypothetical protein